MTTSDRVGALFGTDGVRGIPGRPPLLPATVRALARSAAALLLKAHPARNGSSPFMLCARDTRRSGPALARALKEGFADAGVAMVDLGVAPTPAVSYLAPRTGAIGGVVVSASHNPAEFNGIKFFTGDGFKMGPALERRIEREVAEGGSSAARRGRLVAPKLSGPDLVARYADYLKSTFPASLDLSGMTLAVDCGHGAVSFIAPALLESLGAKVFAIGCSPNGDNINAGSGALEPEAMRREVLRRRADLGISFDGDADRAILADERGGLMDGDALLCLAAVRLQSQGLLRGGKVVVTVMSNFGLLRSLEERGIEPVSVPVGDRNVFEAIEREGLSLGGESSGHIIFRPFAATGDGLLTALQTLAAIRESGRPASQCRRLYHPVPQILKNVPTHRKTPLEKLPGLQRSLAGAARELGRSGRLFVRYSGTEPLLRILIEGPDKNLNHRLAEGLAEAYLRGVKEA